MLDPIMSAAELHGRLGEAGLLVVDVRDASAFQSATIPGAVNLNVYDYFIPSAGAEGVADLIAAATSALRAIGADRARTVVYVEAQTGMISPRGLWFHEFAGLAGGVVLDGGIAAWIEAGGAMVPGRGPAYAVSSGADAVAWPAAIRRELMATVDDVLSLDPDTQTLLDVRRRSEFDGGFVHACCARPGRIPGAAFLFWEDLLEGGRYRSAADIAARAEAAGLSPAHEIVTYCHRGARAATALYGLRRAGFMKMRVFVGSWHQWAENADLPIAIGAD